MPGLRDVPATASHFSTTTISVDQNVSNGRSSTSKPAKGRDRCERSCARATSSSLTPEPARDQPGTSAFRLRVVSLCPRLAAPFRRRAPGCSHAELRNDCRKVIPIIGGCSTPTSPQSKTSTSWFAPCLCDAASINVQEPLVFYRAAEKTYPAQKRSHLCFYEKHLAGLKRLVSDADYRSLHHAYRRLLAV